MSDHSTGSSGSSSNSWTLLSPEEAAIDTAGPVDDGTESTGDVPSISEEVAGSSYEVKPSDSEAHQESVLSEEGHQVCQETAPELFDEGAASGPSLEVDPEICAPVIHATITTSPPDNDLLGAVPFSIATESFFLSQEPFLETAYEESSSDVQPTFGFSPQHSTVPQVVAEAEAVPEFVDKIGLALESVAEIGPATEPTAEIGPALEATTEIGPAVEATTEIGPAVEATTEIGPAVEATTEIGPAVEATTEIGPVSKSVTEIGPVSEPTAEIGPALDATAEIGPVSKSVAEIGPVSELTAEIGPALETTAEMSSVSVSPAEIGPASEPAAEITPFPEPPEASFADAPADVSLVSDISHTSAVPVLDIHTGISSFPESSRPSLSSDINFSSAAESPYPQTPTSSVLEEEDLVTEREEHREADVQIEHRAQDSGLRQRHVHYPEELQQSSEEDDGEETEFKLPERREEKSSLSMNHLIIGALALLCLGTFFLSDDFDGSELSDQELFEKLVEENKQISILEAQIQAQKEDLDRALRAAAEKGITDEEHARMKEELSTLPRLKEELKILKARVAELTQLTGEEPSELSPGLAGEGPSPAGPDKRQVKKDELKRQKMLLEQSKTRLEGMKKQSWPRKWLGERLVEMQQRLSEQVDRIGKKDEWRRKHQGVENRKSEQGVQKHKEHLRKHHDDWEHKKADRKLERERRKQESARQVRPGHKHKHDPKVHHHHELQDFWNLQEMKLRRNRDRPERCHDVLSCAEAEGLVRVMLSDFRGLLDTYLNKLQGLSLENKDAFHHLVGQFFQGGIFSHDRMLFSEFAEDVADILEDLADDLMDDDALEEKMEEFEKEALWQFAA